MICMPLGRRNIVLYAVYQDYDSRYRHVTWIWYLIKYPYHYKAFYCHYQILLSVSGICAIVICFLLVTIIGYTISYHHLTSCPLSNTLFYHLVYFCYLMLTYCLIWLLFLFYGVLYCYQWHFSYLWQIIVAMVLASEILSGVVESITPHVIYITIVLFAILWMNRRSLQPCGWS